MQAEQNQLITRIGPGTPCGALMRAYWHPVALVDEFNPRFDPNMAQRPIKAVRLLGQDLVLFRDEQNRWGLLDRDCPHRGADLSFARFEGRGIRCPFHGWMFDVSGACLETPAEPTGSSLCTRIQQRSYPVMEQSGVLFAWLGEPDKTPPVLPAFDFPWRAGLQPAEKIAALNAWIKDYAARAGCVYLDYYSMMVDDRRGLKAMYSGDGVHPNASGYALMESLAGPVILQALAAR